MTSQEVTTQGERSLVAPSQESLAVLREALGPGEQLTVDLLERAKVPTGGMLSWNVINGDPVREIDGVLILRHATRVFWRERFATTGGGTPPDCYSLDNQVGHGDRGIKGDKPESVHECNSCPLAEWGTAVDDKGQPAAGKACRQVTRAFILRPGTSLPMLVALPPSSYKEALMYTVQLSGRSMPYYGVLTRLTLQKDTSRGGVDYAKARFESLRALTPDEFAQIQSYRDQILPFLGALSVIDVEASLGPDE